MPKFIELLPTKTGNHKPKIELINVDHIVELADAGLSTKTRIWLSTGKTFTVERSRKEIQQEIEKM